MESIINCVQKECNCPWTVVCRAMGKKIKIKEVKMRTLIGRTCPKCYQVFSNNHEHCPNCSEPGKEVMLINIWSQEEESNVECSQDAPEQS